MTALPEFLTEQTEDAIRQRILDALPDDLDKSEGSYIWDSVSPVAAELAQGAIWAQEVRRRGFSSTAASTIPGTKTAELDLRCGEHGVFRKEADEATGTVAKGNPLTITGVAGTLVAAGYRVATPADAVTCTASVEYVTTADATIGVGGTVSAEIKAVVAGAGGNVPAGAITVPVKPVPGVTGVTNAAPIDGGLDEEDDISLLARFLQRVQNPSAGGNRADYIRWAGEVTGVGGVSVIPVRDGPGTVSVAIIGIEKLPASKALIEEVQNYIAPPWKHEAEAEAMTIGGSGTSIDGTAVKMEYNAAGEGTITHADLQTILDRPGIWRAEVGVKASDVTGFSDLLRIGIWNVTTGAWAKVSTAAGAADAVAVLQADVLALDYADEEQVFYWNGTDHVELRIARLTTDNATIVWVDKATFVSTFSRDTGEAKAPAGHSVRVESGMEVIINISANISYVSGYEPEDVDLAIESAIDNYLKGIAFLNANDPLKQADNDVKYGRVWNTIFDVAGVDDCSDLLINGGVSNIPIGAQEVAVKGTVTLT